MDVKELFDQIVKSLPPELIPLLLALGVSFFGVYYYYGLRSYTDVMHSRAFLTIAVICTGAFLLTQVHQSPSVDSHALDNRVALIVPSFENDDRDQYRDIFIQHIRASFSQAGFDPQTVVALDAFIPDVRSAKLHLGRFKSDAAVYAPRVVTTEEGTFICITIFVSDQEMVKPYPPTPSEVSPSILEDIIVTVRNAAEPTARTLNDPTIGRLRQLEQQVAQLESMVLELRSGKEAGTPKVEGRKEAIVVGINETRDNSLPALQFAVTDARAIGSALRSNGYTVTLFENTTTDELKAALLAAKDRLSANDTLVFYYAGSSVQASDLGQKGREELILPMYDFSLSKGADNFSLQDVVAAMAEMEGVARLILLDGCHGTAGLNTGSFSLSPNDPGALMIFAGTQDDQFGFESAADGGGVFTQTLLAQLDEQKARTGEVSILRLASDVVSRLVEKTEGRQRPKVVAFGSEDIFL